MKNHLRRAGGLPAFDLVEEAFVLLRTGPPAALAWYLAGTTPFAGAVLVFCSTMSGHPDAAAILPAASAGLAVLYVWMAWTQARCGALLLAHVRGAQPQPIAPGRQMAIAMRQLIIQSSALIMIPLASLSLFAAGPVCAFYQAASILDDGTRTGPELFRASCRQATLWPGQCFGITSLLTAFSVAVLINWITLLAAGPFLLEMFTGIETVFSRSPWSMLNSTFLAAVLVLTILTVEPLSRACVTLRCFYGSAVSTGDDLRARLRRRIAAPALLLIWGLLACPIPAAKAAESAQPATAETIDTAIREVVRKEKFRWRDAKKLREADRPSADSWQKTLQKKWLDLQRAIRRAWDRFLDWLSPDKRAPSDSASLAAVTNRLLLFALLAAVAGVFAVALVRVVRTRRPAAGSTATPIAPAPDPNHTDTTADALPEEEWMRLGRRLLEEGDYRAALRAFYLGSLAHLASRGIVTITRGKSNRDYAREVGRRTRPASGVAGLFGENVGAFEQTWYGLHAVDAEEVRHFAERVQKMKEAA